MLYDEEDELTYHIPKPIPLRGRMATDIPRMERSCYTQDELEAIAPNMSEMEWSLVSHNKPTERAKRIIQQRIEAAHSLKVKHARSLR